LANQQWQWGSMPDQTGIHLGKCQLGLFRCVNPQNRTVHVAPTSIPINEKRNQTGTAKAVPVCGMAVGNWLAKRCMLQPGFNQPPRKSVSPFVFENKIL